VYVGRNPDINTRTTTFMYTVTVPAEGLLPVHAVFFELPSNLPVLAPSNGRYGVDSATGLTGLRINQIVQPGTAAVSFSLVLYGLFTEESIRVATFRDGVPTFFNLTGPKMLPPPTTAQTTAPDSITIAATVRDF
jgi:hypothetical protein